VRGRAEGDVISVRGNVKRCRTQLLAVNHI
jgi:hypothetical protein